MSDRCRPLRWRQRRGWAPMVCMKSCRAKLTRTATSHCGYAGCMSTDYVASRLRWLLRKGPMKTNLIYPLIAAMLLTGAACRGDRKTAANQQSYETVQEGSAAGVTSTIHGPGEIVPPLTGTNA